MLASDARDTRTGYPPEGDYPAQDDPRAVDPGNDEEYPPSLLEDFKAFYEDGTTYVQAELAYQKTRARFAGDRLKSAAVFGVGALAFVHLALIAFVVGLVIILTPEIGAVGATALVTGLLLVGAAILGMVLKKKIDSLMSAFGDKDTRS